MTRDNQLLWPQTWLPEDLDGEIRVLSVSFDDRPNVSSKRIQLEISQHLLQRLVLRYLNYVTLQHSNILHCRVLIADAYNLRSE